MNISDSSGNQQLHPGIFSHALNAEDIREIREMWDRPGIRSDHYGPVGISGYVHLKNCPIHGEITNTISFTFPDEGGGTYCMKCLRDLLDKKITNLDNPHEIKPKSKPSSEIKLFDRYELLKRAQDSSGNR